MTTTTTMHLEYDRDGRWRITIEAIDYTNGRYAQRLATMAGKPGQNGVVKDQPTQSGFPHKALTYRY